MVTRPRGRSTRLLVFVLVAISIGVISLDYRQPQNGPLSSAGRVMSGAMAPLQRAVTTVIRPIGNFFTGLVHLPTNQQTIDNLRQDLADANARAFADAALRRQLAALQQQAGVVDQFAATVVQADVIANGVSNDQSTFTIGKGSTSGIGVDMPVVTGGPELGKGVLPEFRSCLHGVASKGTMHSVRCSRTTLLKTLSQGHCGFR